jgi:hypothetical protein
VGVFIVPPTLLATLIEQSERTQEEECTEFERCARDNNETATLSLRTLRRWMSGDVQTWPRPAQCRVARIYWGRPMEQLLAPVEPGPGTDSIHRPTVRTADIERQVAVSARRAARFASFAESSNIGPEGVTQLREDVTDLANRYMHESFTAYIGDLSETQDSIFGALEGRQRATLTRDLYLLAAVVSGLYAQVSKDLGRGREAMAQARAMFVCAENAGHTGLMAWARGQQSLIAFRANRPDEAAQYAETGEELSASLAGSVSVWLPALHARALAQRGDATAARAAIGRAAARREGQDPDDIDQIGGLLTFPDCKQHYYAAGTYAVLRDGGADAVREAEAALTLYRDGPVEHRAFAGEAGTRCELALAHARADQLDGVNDALAPVLAFPPERRIDGLIHSANRVHQRLLHPRYAKSPMARDIRERIQGFARVPAAALSA